MTLRKPSQLTNDTSSSGPGLAPQGPHARPDKASSLAALGITREKGFVSTIPGSEPMTVEGLNRMVRRAEGRKAASKVRSYHKLFHGGSRWAKCGTTRRASKVAVRRSPSNGRVHASGVTTCGSQAACIACGTKIRAKRCQEVQTGLRNLLQGGGSAIFATFTIPHYSNDRLEDLWPVLSKCWKHVISGSVWQDFKEHTGHMGYISATEVTFGNNGSHPHKHQLFCFDKQIQPDSPEFTYIETVLKDRWRQAVRKHLGRNVSDTVGVDVRIAKDEKGIGEYLSKIGAELCLTSYKQGRKSSRTPWQIIADGLETGDTADLRLFSEWCRVSKGKKLIQWSAGLRKRLLPNDQEKTEEELANEDDPEAVTEGYITGDIWDALNRRYDGATGDLLTTWENTPTRQAIDTARKFLANHGIQTITLETLDGETIITSSGDDQTNDLNNQSIKGSYDQVSL